MEVAAKLKGAKLSAQKARLVADQIRGKSAESALEILQFSGRKGADIIKKVLESAIANAEHNDGADVDPPVHIQNADDNRIYQVQQRNVNNFCHSAFAITGNINGDLLEDGTGVINIFDLLTLADNIETEVPHCANTTSDFTGDGTIDEFDVIFFATMIIEGQI